MIEFYLISLSALYCQFSTNNGLFYFWSLQSKHEVKDKDQLLFLIRKYLEGMPVIDLKDAYPNVMEDLQVLISLLTNFSLSCFIVKILYLISLIVVNYLSILFFSFFLTFGTYLLFCCQFVTNYCVFCFKQILTGV